MCLVSKVIFAKPTNNALPYNEKLINMQKLLYYIVSWFNQEMN